MKHHSINKFYSALVSFHQINRILLKLHKPFELLYHSLLFYFNFDSFQFANAPRTTSNYICPCFIKNVKDYKKIVFKNFYINYSLYTKLSDNRCVVPFQVLFNYDVSIKISGYTNQFLTIKFVFSFFCIIMYKYNEKNSLI